MAEARQSEAWDHTATLLAMFHAAHRGKGQRTRSPSEFHPFARDDKPARKIKMSEARMLLEDDPDTPETRRALLQDLGLIPRSSA